jgi:hypothetical protein
MLTETQSGMVITEERFKKWEENEVTQVIRLLFRDSIEEQCQRIREMLERVGTLDRDKELYHYTKGYIEGLKAFLNVDVLVDEKNKKEEGTK